ncbi:hypothetical protein [Oscillatoria salina]|uniref:hypothetical protein n=1 Tax=Oscillatoria salina TaxID=331517 RepID=UPI001CCBFDE0|nr:hypothetical protein [Oscillatoria salina]MBZ8182900.1 hypothetical protein [Oscillatoria salina IIICB1]
MKEQIQLIYPTLDLFIYDFREALGDREKKINSSQREFWQKIYANPEYNFSSKSLDDYLLEKLVDSENSNAGFVELLGSKQIEKFELPLNGYYYPLQLGDTYALQINCSGYYTDDRQQIPNSLPQDISKLKEIKKQIIAHLGGKSTQGKIGQTWMVWGQLIENLPALEVENIAKKCYQEIAPSPDWERNYYGQGKFLGATVFELWQQPSGWENLSKENYHLLILLFPHNLAINSIRKKIPNIYIELIRLFCYRNKIIWTYYQSNLVKIRLKENYAWVQEAVKKVAKLTKSLRTNKTKLQQLQQLLTESLSTLADYATDLRELNAQALRIEVSLENYQKRLKQLENNNGEVQFLEEFSDFARERYWRQIQSDYANLNPGLTLLENLLRTIEGTSNISQAASDRSLNATVVAIVTGLAISQISVAVILSQPQTVSETFFVLTPAFVLSVLSGAIAGLIVLLIIRFFRR